MQTIRLGAALLAHIVFLTGCREAANIETKPAAPSTVSEAAPVAFEARQLPPRTAKV